MKTSPARLGLSRRLSRGCIAGFLPLCLVGGDALLSMAVPRALLAQSSTLTLPEMPLHDPFILADAADRIYYLYTSNVPALTGVAGAGTMVYRSLDLKHWQAPVVVFRAGEMRWAQQGAWAPEVHAWRGHYYLFTTVHDEARALPAGKNASRPTYRRGTISAVADSPMGPFHPLNPDGPLAPADFMTLDGTLHIDAAGMPWLVYAHEWLQKTDGTMEAVPLTADLAHASGGPVFLFKASDAPWLDTGVTPSTEDTRYITDGPELFRTRDGHLLMLWSSYSRDSRYIQTVARSASGTLAGPWLQQAPLVFEDSGHGMLFRSFDGTLMMVLHRPFKNARGRLYEMRDAGDHLEVVRERRDLEMPAGTAATYSSDPGKHQ